MHFIVCCGGDGCGSAFGSGFDGAVHRTSPKIIVIEMRRWSTEVSTTTQEMKNEQNKARIIQIICLIKTSFFSALTTKLKKKNLKKNQIKKTI